MKKMGVYALLLVVLFTSTISTTKATEGEGSEAIHRLVEIQSPQLMRSMAFREPHRNVIVTRREREAPEVDLSGLPELFKEDDRLYLLKKLEKLMTPAEGTDLGEKEAQIKKFFKDHAETIATSPEMQHVIIQSIHAGLLPLSFALDVNFEEWGLKGGSAFVFAIWEYVTRNGDKLNKLKQAAAAGKNIMQTFVAKLRTPFRTNERAEPTEDQKKYSKEVEILAEEIDIAKEIFRKLRDKKPEVFDKSRPLGAAHIRTANELAKKFDHGPISSLKTLVDHLARITKQRKRF